MKNLITELEAAMEGNQVLDQKVANALHVPRHPRQYTTSLDAKVPGENIIIVQFHMVTERWLATHASDPFNHDTYCSGLGHNEILARRAAGLKGLDAATEKDTKQ